MQELAAEGCLRRGYSRFKPRRIAKTCGPAISLNLLFVDLQNLIQRKEDRFDQRNLLGEFPEGFPITLVRQFLCCIELLPAR